MSGLGITGVDHVGIAVADLDSALDFYREKFGFEVEHLETNEEQGVTEAMVRVGQSDVRLQILAPLTPESPIAKFLDRSGPRDVHQHLQHCPPRGSRPRGRMS